MRSGGLEEPNEAFPLLEDVGCVNDNKQEEEFDEDEDGVFVAFISIPIPMPPLFLGTSVNICTTSRIVGLCIGRSTKQFNATRNTCIHTYIHTSYTCITSSLVLLTLFFFQYLCSKPIILPISWTLCLVVQKDTASNFHVTFALPSTSPCKKPTSLIMNSSVLYMDFKLSKDGTNFLCRNL